MKILFLTRLYKPHIGGVETHVEKVTDELIKRGHTVTIVTEELKHSNGLADKHAENSNSLKIYRIPFSSENWFKKFTIWKWLWIHKKLIQEADIVHCHDVFFWYLPFKLIFPLKKVYTTFHGYETKFPPLEKAIRIRRLSAFASNGYILVGKFIEKWYGTKSFYITYGAVDKVLLGRNLNSNKTQKRNKKTKIVFVGRLEEDNGLNTYLKALEEINKSNVELLFLGQGSLEDSLKKIGEVKLVKNPEEEIKNADIVFSSSYLSMLQAMVLGKPVFSVYENELKKDYLEMTPFKDYIYISSSSKELVSQLSNYFKKTDEITFKIKSAYNWVANNTWERVTDVYILLWEKK